MVGVRKRGRERVVQHCRGLVEVDAMLLAIGRGFPRIPSENHKTSIRPSPLLGADFRPASPPPDSWLLLFPVPLLRPNRSTGWGPQALLSGPRGASALFTRRETFQAWHSPAPGQGAG